MSGPRVLYIASSGIQDPLIQSQVIRYIQRIQTDECHLITFERDDYQATRSEYESLLAGLGVQWHPVRASRRFRSVNIWRETFRGYRTAKRLVQSHRLNIIHARSFLPGNVGLRTARATGAKLLYDMRGFWAAEKAAKGTINLGWMQRFAQKLENRLFRHADHLVTLTEAAKTYLGSDGIVTPIDVIPCCADTDLFRWDGADTKEVTRVVSAGSLGPGYMPDAAIGFFKAALTRWPNARLQLFTRTNAETIAQSVKRVGVDPGRLEIRSVAVDEMPGAMKGADLGLCMIEPSFAKIASSPTKVAEYLASGIPVIGNCEGIGDMRDILCDQNVGVDVESFEPEGLASAVDRAATLLASPDTRARCRRLAEKRFSVDHGAELYESIYARLLGIG